MKTENLSTLQIHKLTQAQYDRELEAGRIDPTAIYLTPDEEIDLSGYATRDEVAAITPIVYNLTASNDKSLSFNDGQTASQLYSDVRNHKPVNVNVIMGETSMPFQVLTSENEYIRFCSVTSLTQTPLNLSVPANLAIEEQLQFVLRPDSISNLIVTYIQSLDQVESVGKSGEWTYRTWASGVAECWCKKNWDITKISEYGNIFVSPELTDLPDLPITMVDTPYVSMSLENNKVSSFILSGTPHTVSKLGSIYIGTFIPNPTVYSITVHISVKGRWK